MVRRLICTLLCLVTLAGCGTKEKPKQYVAELSNPYLSTLPSSFNKRLDVSYQFQNTLSKEGDFSTIDFLHLEVYKDDVMIGYKIDLEGNEHKLKLAWFLSPELTELKEYFANYKKVNRLQQIDKCKDDIERYKQWIVEKEEVLKKLEEEE